MAPSKRESHAWIGTSLVGAFIYWFLISNGTFSLTGWERFGQAYNSYFLHLLQGSLDVSRDAIGREGFIVGEKTYMYFGTLPAIVRLIFAPFIDLDTTQVGRFVVLGTCVVSASVSHFLMLSAIRPHVTALPSKISVAWWILLGIFAWGASGAALAVANASVYHEPLALGLMLAVIFLAIVARSYFRSESLGPWAILSLALIAGLSLHARPTFAVGLYFSTCVIIAHAWLSNGASGRGHLRDGRHFFKAVIAPVAVMFVFGLLFLALNYFRWGDAFTTAPLENYGVVLSGYEIAARFEAMREFGRFNVNRVPANFMVHFIGLEALHEPLLDFFNAGSVRLESPKVAVSIIFLPFLIMAFVGGFAIKNSFALSNKAAVPMACVGLGFAIVAALILSFSTVTLRYKVEFWPLLLFFALFGLASTVRNQAQSTAGEHKKAIAFWGLCGLLSTYNFLNTLAVYKATTLFHSEGSQEFLANGIVRSLLYVDLP